MYVERVRVRTELLVACVNSGEAPMPVLSMFYGIVIRMYFYDDKRHRRPHVHAEYAGEQAVFGLGDGEVLPAGRQSPTGAGVD